MNCDDCGREAGNGHYIGCTRLDPDAAFSVVADLLCSRDGCSAPRAASKGPTPAKYCEEHKTKKAGRKS